jgi:putative heme-binding domain-containing protein
MRRFLLPLRLVLAVLSVTVGSQVGAVAEAPVTKWIWKSALPGATERVLFRREFQLPPEVTSAAITVTCDNWHRLSINGENLGMGGDWTIPSTYDVLKKLKPGSRNVIAVEGRNEGGGAGLALRFRATLKNGKKLHVVSDAHWLCTGESAEGWEAIDFPAATWAKATVVGKMGDAPWGEILKAEAEEPGQVVDKTKDYQVAAGFKLEQLYRIPSGQGSWVAMTVDGKGRLICSDQYGKLYRVTLSAADAPVAVEELKIPLKGAHGLLWHEGVLWVTVNEGSDQSGVWRVSDSDGDGEPDKPELIKSFKGRGEHGPHGLAASPDGKFVYVVAGNHTDVPEFEKSLVAKSWAEDQLLPRRPDARGHARDRMAPGGWVARFTPDGKNWELFSIGFRNNYDIAFNAQGDLFGYDSDMEWDLGMPWYRPTRICHVVAGSEFGWRNGTGKWPVAYEDSMPSQLDIGPGSPTGMVSGKGAKFPEKYQRAIYALDWTFATIYAIHLTPDGSTYQAQREEFVSGAGLPFTDAVIGHDGTMYCLTGGRRTESTLWRVSYTGRESSPPVSYQSKELALMDASAAVASLGSDRRLDRYHSRVALESKGADAFLPILGTAASTPWQVLGASLGLARVGTAAHRETILAALERLDWSQLDQPQKINWLRAAGLVFARHGQPDDAVRLRVIAKIDSSYPANDAELNRELCRMLSYLQAPGVVSRTLALMDSAGPEVAPDWLELAKRNSRYGGTVVEMIANLPPAQIIHYIYCLREVKGPWMEDERRRFFAWFDKLLTKKGGASYAGFIVDLKKQTLANATPEEQAWINSLESKIPESALANLPEIKGPGRQWTLAEIVALAESGLEGRDQENGKRMFQASLCAACHRHGNDGGSSGPDLTTVGGRFTVHDLAESILEPSKVISTQYAFDLVTRKDGAQVTGKIIEEKDEKWIIATSPFDLSQTIEIERNEIKDIKPSPVSPMPPGLINRLNPDELKDLLAYMLGK